MPRDTNVLPPAQAVVCPPLPFTPAQGRALRHIKGWQDDLLSKYFILFLVPPHSPPPTPPLPPPPLAKPPKAPAAAAHPCQLTLSPSSF